MNKLNVLIVDDAPFVRDALRRILVKRGHNIVGEAEDGNQAVEMALKLRPDVIVMDIVLPQKSGVQATKEIMAQLPATRVVACSTLDQENMLMKIMEAGAADFIHKPFNAADVIKIIEKDIKGGLHAE